MNSLDALYAFLGLAASPVWARKARSGWKERFGHKAPLAAKSDAPRIMIHAVSVGEVNALRTLVPLLADRAELVLSTTTDTGLARATDLFSRAATVVRYPLDFSSSVKRFLDAVQPDAVALVELELWPNFIAACRERTIPVCVINGRLSPRSFRGYRRIRRWIGPSFASLAFAAAQDEEYAQRFRFMGVAPDRCAVTGSMKWDAAHLDEAVPGAAALARDLGIDRSRSLIVAGSTGPGEEALLHGACPPAAQLLCAPRKPERFDDAAAALSGPVRRSVQKASGRPAAPGATRFLLDTIGELRAAYSLADVVVVGRSFGDLHGSDPIEPIALGKPTIIGPAVSDFATIVAEFERAGAIVRSSRESLGADLAILLNDPDRRAAMRAAGRACIQRNQGASRRHADMVMSLVTSRRVPAPAEPESLARA